jgi:arsenate reductase
MAKKTVLFICMHNSCRSQIAEAFINNLYSSTHKAYSAGIKASNVNPYAFEVMKEIGIDL